MSSLNTPYVGCSFALLLYDNKHHLWFLRRCILFFILLSSCTFLTKNRFDIRVFLPFFKKWHLDLNVVVSPSGECWRWEQIELESNLSRSTWIIKWKCHIMLMKFWKEFLSNFFISYLFYLFECDTSRHWTILDTSEWWLEVTDTMADPMASLTIHPMQKSMTEFRVLFTLFPNELTDECVDFFIWWWVCWFFSPRNERVNFSQCSEGAKFVLPLPVCSCTEEPDPWCSYLPVGMLLGIEWKWSVATFAAP